MGLEIIRWECNYLRQCSGWMHVYGRRKIGKTWLLRKCLKWTLYVTVTRGGNCIVEEDNKRVFMNVEEAVEKVLENLKKSGNIVVIDEFQRLPERYWDLIAVSSQESEGLLIICGSSIGIVKQVFDKKSPLLGILGGFHVDLVSTSDTIVSLAKEISLRQALLWAPLARDPWILPHVDLTKDPWEELLNKAYILVPIVNGLIGEVFLEEERRLTKLYEAILRLLALREWNIKMLANKLYNISLISSPQPTSVTGVLHVMEYMGLVKRLPLWKTRHFRTYYMHRSPLLSMLLYIDEVTGGLETGISIDTIKTRYSIELQFTIGELLAKYHKLRQAYTILPGGKGDIDIVLLDRRGNAHAGYEVKLGKVSEEEMVKTVENVTRLNIPRAGIISLIKKPEIDYLDVYGPEDLIKMSLEIVESRNR